MKLNLFAITIFSLLINSSVFAESPSDGFQVYAQVNQSPSAQNAAQNPNKSKIVGTNAAGGSQTTVVDENGNLKMIETNDTTSQTATTSAAPNSPGMTQAGPTNQAPPVKPTDQPMPQAGSQPTVNQLKENMNAQPMPSSPNMPVSPDVKPSNGSMPAPSNMPMPNQSGSAMPSQAPQPMPRESTMPAPTMSPQGQMPTTAPMNTQTPAPTGY